MTGDVVVFLFRLPERILSVAREKRPDRLLSLMEPERECERECEIEPVRERVGAGGGGGGISLYCLEDRSGGSAVSSSMTISMISLPCETPEEALLMVLGLPGT